MPLIRIENHPKQVPGYFKLSGLAAALQQACVTAEVPGIDSSQQVTVVAGGGQLFKNDKTLIVLVECLFDRSDRTEEVRYGLAESLAKHAKANLPPDWKVEVFLKRFNPDKDSYVEISGT